MEESEFYLISFDEASGVHFSHKLYLQLSNMNNILLAKWHMYSSLFQNPLK